ncbi:tRNA lysidine(34) synthetase TilS [Flavobacterium algicola]|uniref:tRNA lysidine(34) synthetase TilS n=1 Tax=Flavobacterium algicola TaxID=556529 RepID=UPI001EFDA38E|nr:tRNA lysidine(34) synthetase TilS [Flavobacterium algicola]MCG9792974.1 tRNA lysidine(34) synthetase TilS [Flavobacterium algicola]
MLENFKRQLADKFPFLENKKLLLATSGGLDSMVMLDLFRKVNSDIAVAHCNFQLRALESFGDQNFIQDYASKFDVPIFVTQFDTTAFARDYKLSTQVAARELRYNWFYELLEIEEYDYILTAHHADDNLETFLINLSRGTGLDGLTGIPEQNGAIVRPLLAFSREDILNYAQSNGIEWREDSSNACDKYLRNKIRHDLVPILKELNPQFMAIFQKTQSHLQDASAMVEDASTMVYQQVVSQEEEVYYIDLVQLLKLPNYKSYLYHWLKDFGFNSWDDIYDLVDSLSGKQILSSDFRLLKDRERLILTPIDTTDKEVEYVIEQGVAGLKIPLKMNIAKVKEIFDPSNKSIFVDEDRLEFPLLLKKWNEGAVFQPLGMEGKTKKLSKFFKDEKMSLIDKENTWILWSGDSIVWIVGKRADERFKVKEYTENILNIQLVP